MMVYIVYCSERFLRGPRSFKKLPEPPVMFRGRKEQAPPADLEPPALQMCCADFSACPPLVEGRGARLVAAPRAGGGEPPRVLARNFTAAPPHASNGEGYQAVGGEGGSPKRCRAQRRAYCPPAKGSPRRRTPTSPSGLRDRVPGLAARQDGGRSSRGGIVVQEPPFSAAQAPQ
ncbi:hypothetical protein NDU88_005573 [Pleurodeles waltl]|uniref:Uncharacterized protein n=1 Tax=Pleurodeles waltl TaxID=8319 RepID=A0AAV7QLD4_PLEWA|nr:hypothetical protein NDU88_005573 [Pleurodeles waltl]